jgi:DNA-binding transcriptional regulator YiaG
MTAAQFKEIQRRLGFNNVVLAERLGVSHISVAFWRTGRRPIRKIVALALLALEQGITVDAD